MMTDTQLITVRGGYAPAEIHVSAGRPVALTFDRQEASPCSAGLRVPAFGIEADLPAFTKTTVEFTPDIPGTYEFTCGMSMLRGSIVVAEAETSRWEIDPDHSSVAFEVRHLMLSRVRGVFGAIGGEIRLQESEFTASRAVVTVQAASIATNQSQRDEHLRSEDFFDVHRFPELRFESTEIMGTPQSFELVGELTVRGVTKAVIFDVLSEGRSVDPWGQERVAYSARAIVDRRDFGLTYNQALEAGGLLIGNEVTIVVDLQAVRQEA